MRFEHGFTVRAPVTQVAAFHAQSASMGRITPPPLIVRVQAAPECLGEGDEMVFTLWAGPLPLRWVARIEEVSPEGFTDRQVSGPFRSWRHRHRFVVAGPGNTAVVDEVEATLKRHAFWGPVGALMWAGLPLLFAYRGWRTRQLLETRRPGAL
jgi:ligand-binding SRPBCC domain-containing protein